MGRIRVRMNSQVKIEYGGIKVRIRVRLESRVELGLV